MVAQIREVPKAFYSESWTEAMDAVEGMDAMLLARAVASCYTRAGDLGMAKDAPFRQGAVLVAQRKIQEKLSRSATCVSWVGVAVTLVGVVLVAVQLFMPVCHRGPALGALPAKVSTPATVGTP